MTVFTPLKLFKKFVENSPPCFKLSTYL